MRSLREEQVDPVNIMLRHHGRCEAIIRQAISMRTLIYFARTDAAGLVLGAGVPIILTAKRLEARMPP